MQVVRCPFCYVAVAPVHIGNSIFVCENCGNTYRVVKARGSGVGRRLDRYVQKRAEFKKKDR